MTDTTEFDFARLTERERYKLLIGAVVPRPIAWVTTVDQEGRVNAAPFSFFNCLSADPAILALGVEYRPDGRQKDTGRNVRDTLAFTVNIVSGDLMEAMNVCAVPFDADVDELAVAGLTTRPGVRVPCPSIAGCQPRSNAGTTSLCRSAIRGRLSWERSSTLICAAMSSTKGSTSMRPRSTNGRMGGHGYATTRDVFDLPTMSVDEWHRQADGNERPREPNSAPASRRHGVGVSG